MMAVFGVMESWQIAGNGLQKGDNGTMYQNPIEVINGQMQIYCENEICKAVQNVGVTVDKNELLRALQYDRGQYQKGYADRDSEIVRCKDCKHANYCSIHESKFSDDWFCADGRRKENA